MSTNLPPEVIAEIIRRLALAFSVHINSMAPGETMSQDNVGLVLGIDAIDNGPEFDDVGFLLKMGVLKATSGGRVPATEMLRFLEEHGDTWALARMEALRRELRTIVGEDHADSDEAET
jgi:hypothetical protein